MLVGQPRDYEDVSHIHFLSHECQTRSLYLLRWFGWQKSTQNALLLTVKSIFDINYNKIQRSLVGILICAEAGVKVTRWAAGAEPCKVPPEPCLQDLRSWREENVLASSFGTIHTTLFKMS